MATQAAERASARVGAPSDREILIVTDRLAFATTRRMCKLPRGCVLFDFDDALVIARAAAWQAHLDYNPARGMQWKPWIITRAQKSLLEAFRQRRYGAPQSRLGHPVPTFLSLEVCYIRDADGEATPMVETVADPRDAYALVDDQAEVQAIATAALRGVTERLRELLMSRYFDEMTHAEAAKRLGVGCGRVRQLHPVALRQAREAIGR
jgi:RNA polymerase sigma factor (sigma-70 family)